MSASEGNGNGAGSRFRFELRASYSGFELDARLEWDAPRAALFGASGSGKSTVLEALAGLRPEVRGSIEFDGRRLDGLAPERRQLGWVPQDASLFPHLTVAEQLAFGARVGGGGAAEMDAAVEALELGSLLGRRPAQLSGGEASRVAIARALSAKAAMLLLDEPLAALDRPLRARVLPYLDRVARDLGVPTLLVSHDPLEVAALADHVAVLERGRVLAAGPVGEVLPGAASFGTLEALSAENRFPARVVERHPGSLQVRTPGGNLLEMASVRGFPDPEGIAVRAEDLLISLEPLQGVSAQNQLAAVVEALEPLSAGAESGLRLHLALGGELWRAAITPRARERLALRPGLKVHLAIKATAVLLDPNPRPWPATLG